MSDIICSLMSPKFLAEKLRISKDVNLINANNSSLSNLIVPLSGLKFYGLCMGFFFLFIFFYMIKFELELDSTVVNTVSSQHEGPQFKPPSGRGLYEQSFCCSA